MADGKFILCRNCGSVHHVTVFDRAPKYSISGGESKQSPADDWREFMNHHAGHRMEAVKSLGEQYSFDTSPGDPMAVGYIEVTNGHQNFLLRRYRRSIEEPLRFEPVEARLGEPAVSLEIQEREIRKELKLRFRWPPGHALNDATIDLFIALFRDAASQIDARGVTGAEPSYSNENLSYAALPPPVKEDLLKNCARHFSVMEVEALRRFMESHCDGSNVMTLMLRRRNFIKECN